MQTIIAVALGGATGAVGRHLVNMWVMRFLGAGFPWATVIVNITGSIMMGVLIGLMAHFWQPVPFVKHFLVVGFLGAFTTFSTFSLDFVTLFERGAYVQAVSYMSGSVVLSILGLFVGLYAVRFFAVEGVV